MTLRSSANNEIAHEPAAAGTGSSSIYRRTGRAGHLFRQQVDEGYNGAAEPLLEGADALPVTVSLRGVFQPIDGRYHWYGRIQHSPALDSAITGNMLVRIRTTYGEAEGRLSDRDPWGRFRLTGTGRPPFPTG